MSPREKKQRAPSWLELAVRRGGVRRGSDVMAFVMCWAHTEAKLGHRPSIEEYAVDWKVSSRTAYRELAAFREVWPEFNDPTGMVELMMRQGSERFGAFLPVPKEIR